MERDIVSDDLPYDSPPGKEQVYLVTGVVVARGRRGLYQVALLARSNREAARAFGAWCRREWGVPALMVQGIATAEGHAHSMARLDTLDEDGAPYYTEHDRALILADDALLKRGVGAWRLVVEE